MCIVPGTSPSTTVYHKVVPCPILYLIFTHSTCVLFPLNLCGQPKIHVYCLPQNCNKLWIHVYANQLGLNAGKTSKLLFQRSTRYIPDWHITLHGKYMCIVSWHHFRHHLILHQTFPHYTNVYCLSISTSTHGPAPSTTMCIV